MRVRTEDARLVLPGMAYAASYLAAHAEGYADSSDAAQAPPFDDPGGLLAHITALNKQDGTTRLPDGPEVERVPFAHLMMVSQGLDTAFAVSRG